MNQKPRERFVYVLGDNSDECQHVFSSPGKAVRWARDVNGDIFLRGTAGKLKRGEIVVATSNVKPGHDDYSASITRRKVL